MRSVISFFTAVLLLSVSAVAQGGMVSISKEKFLDKCKGAWAGQMIGVCYGAPYEFVSNAKPITDPMKEWKPDRIEGSIGQDDLYVEMTFLKALEDYGLGISYEQAGKAFGESKYDLWHANYFGRENIRRGIMPPMSGHPLYNRHADDIDFQIEADLFGILCPGLPHESNQLCDIFGRIMNYGDGLYGGMFVAGMYTAAYFEDNDVNKVIQAGLACIPKDSEFHRCISDVVAWHKENPGDWLATWKKIEEKWQDDVDCSPGNVFNIDAKLNAAYIVMGLVYGEGDMTKTVEVSTRCGQDADCNPSNAAGVLGCMKGFAALGDHFTGGIPAMGDTKFAFTDYSFNSLIPVSQRITENIIQSVGGQITDKTYEIPLQQPSEPIVVEQWVHQKEMLSQAISQTELSLWNPAWRVVACGTDMEPGIHGREYGRTNVLVLHPVDEKTPAVMTASYKVASSGSPKLVVDAASDKRGNFALRILVNGQPMIEEPIDTKGEWKTVTVDLMPYTGKTIDVRVEVCATGWSFEAAYIAKAAFES
ncbi:MAG: ADP-ribosylglycohydrolase family protein [Candidatus Hydrogenedentes bacterium]|nr:ADP-ribosylglycohydrolase family protein [Candidatus Hydrogenedentota bacterium]